MEACALTDLPPLRAAVRPVTRELPALQTSTSVLQLRVRMGPLVTMVSTDTRVRVLLVLPVSTVRQT
ncbi:hypothetical protein DPMN_051685 [Dreissena polymorpha]|uniref:Uncharacterized protein n=1 Tax=Dreissena polymorpha TaxID=45954 RepID=A0A9D4CJL1_DREPO|nr:hypothetical protein DPMN_051685 [Dreissena polymorpha]